MHKRQMRLSTAAGRSRLESVPKDSRTGSDNRLSVGALCELRLADWLLKNNYWVFSPIVNHDGPVDLVAVNRDGEILLLDSKADNKRLIAGRKTPSRIYRTRSELQKKLGVQIAYVAADGTVSITDH